MINIFEPKTDEESIKNLINIFESNWLGRGDYVTRFENDLCDFLKLDKEKFSTNASCSDSIFGIFELLEFEAQSEVIIPSISFPAIASAVIKNNLNPVIIDVEKNSGNVSIEEIVKNITDKTRAIFITHYGGVPVDIKAIRQLISKDIYIFEDAACALGSFKDNIAIGASADFACWSFDAMKLLTCGEGGAFYSNNKKLLDKLKSYFYLGLKPSEKSGLDKMKSSGKWWEYEIDIPGRRSMFTNINAGIGLPQIVKLNKNLERREYIREKYIETCNEIGLDFIKQNEKNVSYSNYFFTIFTKERDQLAQHLKNNGIYTTLRYYPLHKINIFKKYSRNCPNSDTFCDNALNIPIHNGLSDSDINKVCQELKNYFK